MGLQKNIVETLVSTPVRWINFTFANRLISPMGYYYIASMVSNGTIKCGVDSSLNNVAMYDATNNKIIASDNSYGETYFDEKSLLVHECTHAILDIFYNGRDMNNKAAASLTVLEDETIAYIAQAIYVVAANGATPGDDTKPDAHAYKAIRTRVEALMKKGWTGCDTLAISSSDVAGLQKAIKHHALYKDNYSTVAEHNG